MVDIIATTSDATDGMHSFILELDDRLERIERQLAKGVETFKFFDLALTAYRTRELQFVGRPGRLLVKAATDNSLRFPHRKILQCLLMEYDYEKSAFKESYFSRIVRKAGTSKGKTNEYLSDLIARKMVSRRRDSYRVWYRISDHLAGEV